MGLFDEFSQFLETRLEEFLRSNPHLELQALEEQLREQEEDTLKLVADFQLQHKRLEEQILETAQEIQRWHIRIEKAKQANRWDLVQPAQEREASLLRQGNQLWGQMQGVNARIQKARELQKQIQSRRQEVRAKAVQAEAEARAASSAQSAPSATTGWNQGASSSFSGGADPLDEQFRRWEAQAELDDLKRQMGR